MARALYLERVADFAADVREGDVQARHDDSLQLAGRDDVWIATTTMSRRTAMTSHGHLQMSGSTASRASK